MLLQRSPWHTQDVWCARRLTRALAFAATLSLAVTLGACGGESATDATLSQAEIATSAGSESSSSSESASAQQSPATESASPSEPSGDDDCKAALRATLEYSAALGEMARALELNDQMVVVGAADTMSAAVANLREALPNAPAEAVDFLTAIEGSAILVKQGIADGKASPAIIAELSDYFGDPSYDAGSAALGAYFEQSCADEMAEGDGSVQ